MLHRVLRLTKPLPTTLAVVVVSLASLAGATERLPRTARLVSEKKPVRVVV
jgi:hypothetical protein